MSDRSPRWTDALAAAGLFLACWALVHTWFWSHGQLVDWPGYRDYGKAMLDGKVPYRDFAVEYPPGSLPAFVAPAPFDDYARAFAWLMAACGVGLVAVLAYVRQTAALYAALAPVLVGSLILSRFDLWPALVVTAAVAALLANRHVLGWGLLGAAVSIKLWPFVVAPVALVWSYRNGHVRSVLAGVLVVLVVFLPFAILAPHELWYSLRGQASRPLQIESLGAAFFTTFGHPHVVTTHGSQNLVGHGVVEALLSIAGIAAVVAAWAGFAAGPATRERFVRYAAAAVAAFVAFDKVLSPQYLLWLIPLVPLVRGRRGVAASLVLAGACVLTQVWFPLRYWRYAGSFHLAWVVLARDLLLVALFALLVLPSGLRVRRGSSTVK